MLKNRQIETNGLNIKSAKGAQDDVKLDLHAFSSWPIDSRPACLGIGSEAGQV
jgi:hypothetical protein